MVDTLEELIEEWKHRAGGYSFSSPENFIRKVEIEECIDDLKSTMRVMEANKIAEELRKRAT